MFEQIRFPLKPGALWLLPGIRPVPRGGGLWTGFEFNERRPGREVAIETGPFQAGIVAVGILNAALVAWLILEL
ncbi:hypothetical protein BSZ19_09710 [Bradyrhizobium japonicum]|uniref:Uncharacterized protein n=1 Tax=Bradyrhizobium japonicum TaxID=375 RepID=A0A1Y2JWB3_BRAJP|nr:hypothetical protein BSZ19_09710 [Bradyrhizobium japonicum]